MRKWTVKAAGLLLAMTLAAQPAFAQMGGMEQAPVADDSSSDDVKPVYQGPHQIAPLSQTIFDKAVSALFNKADLNHDGMVTLAELQQIITKRRDSIILKRFNEVDANHNGAIDLAEFTAWQQGLGSAASSKCASYAAQANLVPETLGPDLGSSERDEALAIAIDPLSALLITKANIHYGLGLTLGDLLTYEDARFKAADTNHDQFLEQSELLAMRKNASAKP